MKVAISFSSKNRADLTRQTLPAFLTGKFDAFWFDASTEDDALKLVHEWREKAITRRLEGGSCRYIVTALTLMLADDNDYEYVGLVENDCLLHEGWFEACMNLFTEGERIGLPVGAVSARCYEDRILIQLRECAIMHNLGAGMVIFTRKAAEIILNEYRTHVTTENRRIFSLVSGIDIGAFWAFRGSEHMLVADWGWDRALLEHGHCSIALTPSMATQLEDLDAMGLTMATEPVLERGNEKAFATFRKNIDLIRKGRLDLPRSPGGRLFWNGEHIIFPHQVPTIGGNYTGDWRFRWSLGWGCFAWKAGSMDGINAGEVSSGPILVQGNPSVTLPLIGPCTLLVTGGEKGGRVRVEDERTGFQCEPELYSEGQSGNVLEITIPGSCLYRNVRLTALTSGVSFFGVKCALAQYFYVDARFDFYTLPPL
jgi:hypothetical protein